MDDQRPTEQRHAWRPRKRNWDGFTLVEIMITVGVTGLLMIFAVAGVRKAIAHARVKQAETDLEMLLTAVNRLACDTGRFPAGMLRTTPTGHELWDLTTEEAGLMKANDAFREWRGPYITRIPLDPWGQPYFFDSDYRIEGKDHVVLGSFGPNRHGRNAYDSDDVILLIGK